MIKVVSINPYNDLARGEELLKRVPELEILHGGGVVLEYGEEDGARHVVVRNQDLFHPLPLEAAPAVRISLRRPSPAKMRSHRH